MAILQVGRLFSDVDVDVRTSAWDGRRWSITGDVLIPGVAASRVGQGQAIREQIVAMANNPDEPVVPVRWSMDSSVDGYYRVLAASVDIDPIALTDGTLRWSIELERLSNHQYSPVESVCSWQLISNARSITAGTMSASIMTQFAWPSSAWDIGPVSGTVSGVGTSIGTAPTADGVSVKTAPGPPTLPASGVYGYSVAPASFYQGHCRVTTTFGTAAGQLVFGRRQDGTTNWQISNGLVRVSETVAGDIRIEHWDGTAWRQVNATDWRVQVNGITVAWSAMAVLRNSPEEVVIRVAGAGSSILRTYLDIAIKRGSRLAYCTLTSPPTTTNWPTAAAYSVQSTASVPCTLLTGGMRATTADVNGHQFVLVATSGTDTVATGRITNSPTSPGYLGWGLGVALAASGAQDQAYEFFARRSETMRVVAR